MNYQKFGYCEDLLDLIASTSEMECPEIDIDVSVEYQTFENVIISTNNVIITQCDTQKDFA